MTELSYFEDLYRDDPDPWRLISSPYERRKRAITLTSLPRDHYRRGFEPACATGQLTALLAGHCDELVAADPVEAAVARVRALQIPGVDVSRGAIPHDWPEGSFDLVVLSEVLYFLDAGARAEVAAQARRSLSDDGHLVAVHWRHWFEESATPPADAHVDLHRCGLRLLVAHVEEDFKLEVFARG